MIKLSKYLKPYIWLVVLCVSLVFVQAMCDLKLPDYMSDIVNIGIQRSGIEDSVPVKMRSATFSALLSVMTGEQQALISQYYTRTEPAGDPAGGWVDYQAPESKSRAQINTDRQEMDTAFTDACITLAVASGQVPASMLETMGESVAGQITVAALKAEYQALGVDLNAIQMKSIMKTGAKMLAVALVIALSAIGAGFLSSRVASGFARDIRGELFQKVTTFSSAEINKFSTASLITRTTNDVQQVQQVVTMMMRIVVFAPIMGVGGLIYALQKSVSLSWTIALAVLVLICLMGLLFSLLMPKFKIMQSLIDRLNRVTREIVSGTMVSRAYNAQQFEIDRFDVANKDISRTNLFVTRASSMMDPIMMLVMNGLMILIIWFGSHHIAESTLLVGDMMAYMQYAMHVVMSFLFVSAMFIMIPRAAISGDRIAEVLFSENSVVDPDSPKLPLESKAGYIEFKNVSFRYPGAEKDSLSDISFTALPGQTTAVIGSTGSGKTTLANLMLRFYDATGGSVLVGGVDVREQSQHSLRGQIGYVPQKSVLFTGTIGDNIRFGAQDASNEQIEQAAATAQAMNFVKERDNGFDEHISQGGSNVSGGQRQRLSIARALASKAPIYLFDDSFSALDFKTDAALRRALKTDAAGATLFIVAQRVGTIMNADQIIVLEEGKIVGLGTHAQLMKSCGVYQDIARSQLKEEELA